MSFLDSLTPNQDERIMGGLSHIAILIPYAGLVAPIVIWVTQKDKSRYVAFHAIQAIAFNLLMMICMFAGMGCYFICFIGLALTASSASSSEISSTLDPLTTVMVIIPFLIMGIFILGGFAFMIYGIVGAVRTFMGKPFRYAVIGRRVERYMQKQNTLQETP